MAGQKVRIQEVLKKYNQRLSALEKQGENEEKFDMDGFKKYVEKIDEGYNFLKKANWDLGHTVNKLEAKISDLQDIIMKLISKNENND